MADYFEDRINHDASFFDGILSLTPVDLYFGRDNSNQWQTKKQPLNKKRDSRLAKLDPANAKAARDLVDEINPENETKKKRKREEVDEEGQDIDIADGSLSDVGDGQDKTQGPNIKKQKRSSDVSKSKRATGEEEEDDDDDETIEDRKRKKAAKRAEKRARKNDLKAKTKEKKEQQKARKKSQQTKGDKAGADELNIKEALTFEPSSPAPQDDEERKEEENSDQASTPSSEDERSEIFSPQHESGTSSTSSIHPSTLEETLKPTSDIPSTSSIQPSNLKDTLDTATPAATSTTCSTHDSSSTPHERLQAAIQQRRAERKADGADGRAPKNRQELLEQRRRKEEQRKAAKKEQKRREKEEEARLQDEEIARRFSPGGSGSLLASPRSPVSSGGGGDNNVFSFGRIAFADGTHFDPSTADVVDEHTRKGPRDTAAQLKTALAKKNKLSGLDEAKRREIEQKDMWLNAKKRAHGEHVKDDTSLLKKALKRQQGQKRKSEREWTDRIQGVQKAQGLKQKKRTENLAKRKEDKHKGGGNKMVKRPGFEGSFKGRTGGRKK